MTYCLTKVPEIGKTDKFKTIFLNLVQYFFICLLKFIALLLSLCGFLKILLLQTYLTCKLTKFRDLITVDSNDNMKQ